ncbi:hypothetical protein GFY24_03585 [Nocardia sp. SYP-A9097]|uniref:hypothetical protein n=1 Tax=Nocardia sp. SYP-A9097 TaxID=2663237 RepID=UPI00132ADF44|nr:hypothetical protein [Nocardia sp. SYP-A9097]MRH86562.1 hypothetical protein [Nocardia sp. SYP-A9097]
MRISLIAAALVAVPLLAGCGGGGDDKPAVTQAEIAKSLQDGGLKDEKLANCAAKLFVDEGISQDGLRLMIKNDAKAATAVDPESMGLTGPDIEKARSATNKIVSQCLK